MERTMMIFIVYKNFKGWDETSIPVAAYSKVTDAAASADKLNYDRTPEEIAEGLMYYADVRGVPVNG